MQHVRLTDHIIHKSGRIKSVCVTACLTALGVPVEAFQYTGSIASGTREIILRRQGYAVRSRMSYMPRMPTVGNCRFAISRLSDPIGTYYMVCLGYGRATHCILMDTRGNTVVDTAPRRRDGRRVISIKAVFKA